MTKQGRHEIFKKLHVIFYDPLIEAILKIPISIFFEEDKLVWVPDKKSAFSVRFTYGANQSIHFDEAHKSIWIGIWRLEKFMNV